MLSAKLDAQPETTQEALLLHLKRQGEMTVAQLSALLKITEMAVRRHLAHLQSKNLVESRLVNQGRGRPNYVYRLGAQAATLFPSGFDSLAKDILHIVKEESGHQGVTTLLKKRNQLLASRLKDRMLGKDLSGRVAEISKFFCEDGYMTEWKQLPDGNFMIYQRNCALHDLANQYRQICALEPQLIEELLGAKVTRQTHILNNDPVCGYLVQSI